MPVYLNTGTDYFPACFVDMLNQSHFMVSEGALLISDPLNPGR